MPHHWTKTHKHLVHYIFQKKWQKQLVKHYKMYDSVTYVSVLKLLSGRRFSSFDFRLFSISASHFSSFAFRSAASYKKQIYIHIYILWLGENNHNCLGTKENGNELHKQITKPAFNKVKAYKNKHIIMGNSKKTHNGNDMI